MTRTGIREDPSEEVRLALGGDRSACADLYRAFLPLVHSILLARTPRQEVADLEQEVFLRAFDRLPDLRDPKAFGPWIAGIARNLARDWYRRRRPSVPVRESDRRLRPPPPEALEALEALRQLPEAYRDTLTLRLVEGLTGPEIAEISGLTHGSVRVNLHRGMKLLRQRLTGEPARQGGDPAPAQEKTDEA